MSHNMPRLSRREFLRGTAVASAALVVAACQPTVVEVEKVVKETVVVKEEIEASPASESKEIRFWPSAYTPSKYIGRELEPGDIERVAFDDIANEWMAQHPDYKITFIAQPGANVREAIVTMQVSGTAPDITWTQPDMAVEDVGKGWWLPLDPWTEQPNPYITSGPGSEKWHDLFLPSFDYWRAPDGNLYTCLGSQTAVGYYANLDVLDKVGATEPAKTWEEFMETCDKLKGIGIPGFSIAGAADRLLHQLTWTSGWLAKYFFYPIIPALDADENGVPDKWEIADAIKAGIFTAGMEENVERLRVLKRSAQYWQEGALGCDDECSFRQFLTGGTGYFQNTIGVFDRIYADPNKPFKLGWHYLAPLTKATSELVPDDIPMTNVASGYGSFQYAISQTARWHETADMCADFLAFSTVPENISAIVNEAPNAVPNVKGGTAHPAFAEFPEIQKSVSYPFSRFQEDDSLLDLEYGDNFAEVVSLYCIGELAEDDMIRQLQGHMDMAADRTLAKRALMGAD